MTYEEARREVRKLLRSDKGEVKELPQADDSSIEFLPYRFLVGTGRGRNFIALGAGMNWAEAIEDLKKRLNTKEAGRGEGKGEE